MQYRKFGKLDWEVSALGFGGFRFPILNGKDFIIDQRKTIELLRYGIDHGINYIDTAYTYHYGTSEVVIGLALQDGYREKVKVATKQPVWLVQKNSDFDRLLNEELDRLQLDYIDFYLLHATNRERWQFLCSLGIREWAEKAMRDGRFRQFGFSFHGELDEFKEIVGDYDNWAMCLILLNYVDEDYQAGCKGLEYAAEKGLAVAVMEPLRGGGLVKTVPPDVQAMWDSAKHKRTPADWALQWVWNFPQVSVALSGMTTLEEVKENIKSADNSQPDSLTKDEIDLIHKVRDKYLEKTTIRCSNCRYCMPCQKGVFIPRIFEFYNEAMMFDDKQGGMMRYNTWLKDEEKANLCVKCGECVKKCPQEINIPGWLSKIHDLLVYSNPY